jgi:anti-anti-sigma factor
MALEMSPPPDLSAASPPQVDPLLRMEIAPRVRGFTVWLAGDIDLATRDALRDLVAPIAAEGHHVVLDLRDVTFLDSSGINLFVGLHQQCRASGGSFALESPTPATLSVLRLSGVDAVLTIT